MLIENSFHLQILKLSKWRVSMYMYARIHEENSQYAHVCSIICVHALQRKNNMANVMLILSLCVFVMLILAVCVRMKSRPFKKTLTAKRIQCAST